MEATHQLDALIERLAADHRAKVLALALSNEAGGEGGA